MDEVLREFALECAALFAELSQVLGMPRSVGQIYGLLFASPAALSLTDIVGLLEISKGSASQGLHALREIGAIRPAAGADGVDGRREHFVAETELRRLITVFLRSSIQPHLQRGTRKLEGFKVRMGPALAERGEPGKIALGRLRKLQSWHRRGTAVLPLITKFLG